MADYQLWYRLNIRGTEKATTNRKGEMMDNWVKPWLFNEHEIRNLLNNRINSIGGEVEQLDANRLGSEDDQTLCDEFEYDHLAHVPIIDDNNISIDPQDVLVDLSQTPPRIRKRRIDQSDVPGTLFTFNVPFEGEAIFFKCVPTTYTLPKPAAALFDDHLELQYLRTIFDESDPEKRSSGVKAEFEGELATIRRFLASLTETANKFNSTLRHEIQKRIENRRGKLSQDHAMALGTGYPLRRRSNAPQTYVVPAVRRKIRPVTERVKDHTEGADATDELFEGTPTWLEMSEYEHILSIMQSMVTVMEQSPHAFRNMEEEDIRTHFLVQLNGQYHGQATGETFNYEGKTDILIRVGDRTIFIAECKFWKGPESLEKAIDQLLRYMTWRDTKAAIVLFNRNKGFSEVVAKVPGVAQGHPHFFANEHLTGHAAETQFRYRFTSRDDPSRQIILTIMAFDVPV